MSKVRVVNKVSFRIIYLVARSHLITKFFTTTVMWLWNLDWVWIRKCIRTST